MATTAPQPPSSFPYGQSAILVQSDDFEDGYYNGLLSHPGDEIHPLADTALFAWIVQNILDMRASNTWNTGYLLGSIRSLLIGSRDLTHPEAPQVQCGSVTLLKHGVSVKASTRDRRTPKQAKTSHHLSRL